MTFSVKHVVGVASGETRRGFFGTKEPLFGAGWDKTTVCGKWTLADVWTYVVGCHVGHLLEFSVALLAYWLFFADGSWELECGTLRAGWIARVLIFHLACEIVLVGCWHWLTHVSDYARGIRGQVQSGKPIHKDRQCALEKRSDFHHTGMAAERSLADRSHIPVGLETAAQLLHRVLGAPDILCFRRRCSDLLARNTLLLVS